MLLAAVATQVSKIVYHPGYDRMIAACYSVVLLGYSKAMQLNHPTKLASYSLRKLNLQLHR